MCAQHTGICLFCVNRKLRPYYIKTFRGDAYLAVRYIMLCIPLGRKCAASAHFVFRKKERHRKTRQNQFMILPGFVTAETAGFEPACPKGANAFRVRLVMTTSIRLRKVWQPSAIFAERIRNLRCSSRDLRDRCSILVRRARIRSLRYSFAGFAL